MSVNPSILPCSIWVMWHRPKNPPLPPKQRKESKTNDIISKSWTIFFLLITHYSFTYKLAANWWILIYVPRTSLVRQGWFGNGIFEIGHEFLQLIIELGPSYNSICGKTYPGKCANKHYHKSITTKAFSFLHCPKSTASIKSYLELHLPHCVPCWCQSSSELHFPFVNAGCVDLFKNITQVPGETWCLPALQI